MVIPQGTFLNSRLRKNAVSCTPYAGGGSVLNCQSVSPNLLLYVCKLNSQKRRLNSTLQPAEFPRLSASAENPD